MADALVITGTSDGAPSDSWVHGIGDLTNFPNGEYKGVAFLGYTPGRVTEHWGAIDWQGAHGVDEKFFGRQPLVYFVKGVICSKALSRTTRYSDIETEVNNVMALSAGQHEYSLAGPINRSFVVARKPEFQEIGINTGPFMFFIQPFEDPKG